MTVHRRGSSSASLKTFIDSTKGARGMIGAGFALSVIASLGALAQPMVTSYVLDAIDRPEALRGGIQILAIVFIGTLVLQFFGSLTLLRAAETQVARTRRTLFADLLAVPVRAMRKANAGDLVTRFTGDANAFRAILCRDAVKITTSGITIIGALVLMFILNPELLMVCIATMMVPGILMGLLFPFVSKLATSQRRAQGGFAGHISRVLGGFSTVKLHHADGLESRTIASAISKVERIGKRSALVQAGTAALSQGTLQLTFVVALGAGSLLAVDGRMSVPNVVAFMMYIGQLTAPASVLVGCINSIQLSWASIERVAEVQTMGDDDEPADARGVDEPLLAQGTADAESAIAPVPRGSHLREGSRPVLEFSAVSFGYEKDRPVLKDMSLLLESRGLVSIIGESGSGKSTALDLIAGTMAPDSGEVVLNGHPVEFGRTAEGRSVAFVEQDSPLLVEDIVGNLLYGQSTEGVESLDEGEISDVLSAVGLAGRFEGPADAVGKAGNALSGGERQRVAIARGVLRRADVLVLDEPTASLDGGSEKAVLELLRDISRDTLVVMTAHREAAVAASDLVVVMRNGRVLVADTPSHLSADGFLESWFDE